MLAMLDHQQRHIQKQVDALSGPKTAAAAGAVTMGTASDPGTFDPTAWLTVLSSIGDATRWSSSGRLALMVHDCDAEDLAVVMSYLIGHLGRQEAVKLAIEQRQNGR